MIRALTEEQANFDESVIELFRKKSTEDLSRKTTANMNEFLENLEKEAIAKGYTTEEEKKTFIALKMKERLEALNKRIADLEKEKSGLETKATASESERTAKLEKDLAAVKGEKENIEKELTTLRAAKNENDEQVIKLKAQLKDLQNHTTNLQETLERLYKSAEETKEKFQQFEKQTAHDGLFTKIGKAVGIIRDNAKFMDPSSQDDEVKNTSNETKGEKFDAIKKSFATIFDELSLAYAAPKPKNIIIDYKRAENICLFTEPLNEYTDENYKGHSDLDSFSRATINHCNIIKGFSDKQDYISKLDVLNKNATTATTDDKNKWIKICNQYAADLFSRSTKLNSTASNDIQDVAGKMTVLDSRMRFECNDKLGKMLGTRKIYTASDLDHLKNVRGEPLMTDNGKPVQSISLFPDGIKPINLGKMFLRYNDPKDDGHIQIIGEVIESTTE